MSDKFWIIDNGSESYLSHHGIKGQKWGVRRYQNPDGSLTEKGKKRYARKLSGDKGISLLEKKGRSAGSFDIYDKDHKKIGDIIIDDEGDNDHIDWLGIKESERRNGYGQAVLDSIIKDATDRGKKSLTLDAAGLDPAAIHIYEKKGFKPIKKLDDNGVWSGLIVMKKELKHSDV